MNEIQKIATMTLAENRAREVAAARHSSNTKFAYKKNLKHFVGWLGVFHPQLSQQDTIDLLPLPKALVMEYLNYCLVKDGKVSTVRSRLSTLSSMHDAAIENGLINDNYCKGPHVSRRFQDEVSKRATEGQSPKQKKALTADILDKVLERLQNDGSKDVLQRAVLLFCFCSGGRRVSEACLAFASDFEQKKEHYIYSMPFSKTNKTSEPEKIIVKGRESRAYLALKQWCEIRNPASVYMFHSLKSPEKPLHRSTAWKWLKTLLYEIGENAEDYTFHSLRSGYATEAILQNIPEMKIRKNTKHSSVRGLERYVRLSVDLNCPSLKL